MRAFEEFIDKVGEFKIGQYQSGFIDGVQWYREGTAKDEHSVHVAEVVKCGQVNQEEHSTTTGFVQISSQKTCEHLNVDLPANAGYMCPKCGKWINGPSI